MSPQIIIHTPGPSSSRAVPIPQKKSNSPFLFVLFLFLVFSACSYFVILSVSPNLPQLGEPPKLYSNQLQQDLRLTLVDSIRKATKSIHLVMFGLSDPAIVNAISNQKIQAKIYYDSGATPNLWTSLPNAELHPLRGKGLMHQKILVIDGETSFIGSANMTTASLSMHDNLVIGMKSKKIANFLTDKSPRHSGYLQTSVAGQRVELWLLPDPRGYALHDMKKKIRSSIKSIRIALFTFTHPTLIEEVIHAHKRGVDVSVVVDMHSGLGASRHAIERLKKVGVKVSLSRGVQLLHHKFILIDNRTLLTGSANWTKAAFYKNSDCFLILHSLDEEQKSFMNRLWTKIESEAQVLRDR